MNHQEVFDKVSSHLLSQNRQSLRNGKCRYRGEGGLKCAIGCLIPDSLYMDMIEERGVGASAVVDTLSQCGITIEDWRDQNLLCRLQSIHDDSPVEEWNEQLRSLAEEFSLTFNARTIAN